MRAPLIKVVKDVFAVGVSDIGTEGISCAKIQGKLSGQDDSTYKVPAANVTRAQQVGGG